MTWYNAAKDALKGAAGMFVPPVKAALTHLGYEDLRSEQGATIVFLCPDPWRYRAVIELTNVSDRVVFVKRMTLSFEHAVTIPWSTSKPIRLEPAEFTVVSVSFPVSRDHKPVQEGDFVLCITPSVGRARRIQGRLPLDRQPM